MSDYLTQLVMRSLDLASVVRPRPASLFAPEQAAAQPAFAPESSIEPTTELAPPQVPPRPRYDGDSLIPQAPLTTIQTQAEQPQPLSNIVSVAPRQPAAPPLLERSAEIAPLPESVAPRRQPAPPLLERSAEIAPLPESAAPRRQPAHIEPEPLSSLAVISPTPVPTAENGPPRGDAVAAQPAPGHLLIERVIERVIAPERSYSVDPRPLAPSPPESIAPRRQPAQAALQPLPAPASQRLLVEQTVVSEPSYVAASPRLALSQAVEPLRSMPAAAGVQPALAQAQSIVEQPMALPAASMIQPVRRSAPATIAPPVRRSPPATSATAPAASTPTIQVTIGRIEVRATPPPAPAARPKSAPTSTMSLDDYLRERGGGRR